MPDANIVRAIALARKYPSNSNMLLNLTIGGGLTTTEAQEVVSRAEGEDLIVFDGSNYAPSSKGLGAPRP
jgi:hypothetical protein